MADFVNVARGNLTEFSIAKPQNGHMHTGGISMCVFSVKLQAK
jgi:hypothetical protein